MLADSLFALGAFVLVNFAAATSGAVFKPGAWYEGLAKPRWTPPNLAFPIVWTTLFLMNAVSGWLVWEKAGAAALPAFAVYALSLALNAGWSALFFGAKRMDAALVEVVLLFASIAAVAALFLPHSPAAAALQLPYLAWVGVASFLNYRLLRMNAAA